MKAALAGAAGALLGAGALSGLSPRGPYPPPTEVRLAAEDAVTSASLVSVGMRRLAADLAFIRLLLYYGTPEDAADGSGHEHGHDGHDHGPGGHGEPERHGAVDGGGSYPELGPRVERILSLDPFWEYPVLYGAGALAFNLGRPEEALRLLKAGLSHRPEDPRYLAYIAAVGFSRAGDMARAVEELAPAVAEPDAPTMLKNIVAFMHVRLGRREEAARLYRDILRSRDESYHENARRALKRLGY